MHILTILGLEKKLWKAADSLRGNVDPSQYKYIVLGLVFLKYISDRFLEVKSKKMKGVSSMSESHKEAYLKDKTTYESEGVFVIPESASWSKIVKNSTKENIAEIIDIALQEVEISNKKLQGVLWKEYTRQILNLLLLENS